MNKKTRNILLIIILVAILLRIFWFNTIIERDEATFGQVAWRMSTGEKLYENISEFKPPGIFLTYLIGIEIFGNNIYGPRIINDLLFIISIIFLYLLVKRLKDEKTGLISAAAYVFLMNVPFYQGFMAMTEPFANYFIIITAYLLTTKTKKYWVLILAGISTLIALGFKQPAAILIVPMTYLLFEGKEKTKRILVYFTPIITSILFLAVIFRNYYSAIKNIVNYVIKSYIGNTTTPMKYVPIHYFILIISQGIIMWYLAIVWIINFLKIKTKTRNDKFILIWFLCGLVAAIIPPSYGHYYIFLIAPASIMIGETIAQNFKKKSFLIILVILIVISLLAQSTQWNGMTINTKNNIYATYSGFITKQSQRETINFLKNNLNENETFIAFGWDPELYWLTKRKPPTKSVSFFKPEHFLETIKNKNVKYILIFNEQRNRYEELFYNNKTIRLELNNYELIDDSDPQILKKVKK